MRRFPSFKNQRYLSQVMQHRKEFQLEPGPEQSLSSMLGPGFFVRAPSFQFLFKDASPMGFQDGWVAQVGGVGFREKIDAGLESLDLLPRALASVWPKTLAAHSMKGSPGRTIRAKRFSIFKDLASSESYQDSRGTFQTRTA